MNYMLVKNRPKDSKKEEFVKMWDNLGYSLEALAKTIKELQVSTETVKSEDFSIPNHYALLAYQAGKKHAYQEIFDMLPDTAKNI